MAKLYFKHSPMNAGKSTAIIQTAFNYEERGQNVVLVKPTIDTKDEEVSSRIGYKRKVDIHAFPETDLFKEISLLNENKTVNCVLVDEVQFLTPAQVEQIFLVVIRLDIPVMGFGLRTDFQTHSFPGSMRMMELAHSLEEMKTICRCGAKAIFNGRKIDGAFVKEGDQVAIDQQAAEYESLCGKCYDREIGF